jgi:hypothetical protein
MKTDELSFLLGGPGVTVATTSGRGFTPEEIAERALDKIISVGSQSHPAIRDQAEAFRAQIRQVLIFYMKEAIKSHNVTLSNRLTNAGYSELISLLDS